LKWPSPPWPGGAALNEIVHRDAGAAAYVQDGPGPEDPDDLVEKPGALQRAHSKLFLADKDAVPAEALVKGNEPLGQLRERPQYAEERTVARNVSLEELPQGPHWAIEKKYEPAHSEPHRGHSKRPLQTMPASAVSAALRAGQRPLRRGLGHRFTDAPLGCYPLDSRRRSPPEARSGMDAASLKEKAYELGFDLVGVAPAGPAPHARAFLDWIDRGCAGEMHYMVRTAPERADPTKRFPWARSIVCVAMRYPAPPAERPARAARARVSCYALGDDYHGVMERPMGALAAHLERMGASEARPYVDTGPVLERDWAARAGLGWIGKNTALINEAAGSWLFLGVILTDLELDPDEPVPDRCGKCTECIDACPTGALTGPRLLDSRLCISYLTIEFKGVLPRELRGLTGEWVFGCDLCQTGCPWNSDSRDEIDPAFTPRPELADLDLGWALRNPDKLGSIITGTAIERARGERLIRNLVIAAGNSGRPELARALEPYAVTASSALAEQVSWALKRLRR